jgi:hypothetical protein
MKTIFALFQNYADADEAVDALLEEGFDEEQMNVVIREDTAKENLDLNLHQADVMKTDEVGEQTIHGLQQLLGGEQPVHVPDIGLVLAAGDLATLLSTGASASWAPDQALTAALEEFGVPANAAEAYREGINAGGVLTWVRVDDERAAAAAGALRGQNGQHVGEYS